MPRANARIGWALVAATAFAPGCAMGGHGPANYWEDPGQSGGKAARNPEGAIPARKGTSGGGPVHLGSGGMWVPSGGDGKALVLILKALLIPLQALRR